MRKLADLLAISIVLVGAAYLGWHLVTTTDWELVSTKSSPDDEVTVSDYRSRAEAGHAPYGDHLTMSSWRSFPRPREEDVFFPGIVALISATLERATRRYP